MRLVSTIIIKYLFPLHKLSSYLVLSWKKTDYTSRLAIAYISWLQKWVMFLSMADSTKLAHV